MRPASGTQYTSGLSSILAAPVDTTPGLAIIGEGRGHSPTRRPLSEHCNSIAACTLSCPLSGKWRSSAIRVLLLYYIYIGTSVGAYSIVHY